MAWREFRRGKIKKKDVQEFEFNLEDNLFLLREELQTKTYKHREYRAFYVRDPKLRHIHKATVRDRVVHQALFRILYQIFDKSLIFHTYSCRKKKGAHRAIKRFIIFAKKESRNIKRPVFVLKCDIKKFFDSIDKSILLELVKNKIADEEAVWLIQKIIDSFEKEAGKGLPLGNVTSQLFANIYLNELDQYIKKKLKIKYYIRYSDDFVILNKNRDFLVDIILEIQKFLIRKLRLSLHEKKVIIRKYSAGIDFLGYVIRPHCITLRTKTKNRILKKIIQDKTSATQSLQSYLGILGHCCGFKIKKEIIKILSNNDSINI